MKNILIYIHEKLQQSGKFRKPCIELLRGIARAGHNSGSHPEGNQILYW